MRRFVVLIASLAFVLSIGLGAGSTPDAPVAASLAAWVGPSRQLVREGLPLVPVRFADAWCSDDGRMAILAFESVVATRYAVVALPARLEWAHPGATVGIVAVDVPPTVGGSAAACAGLPR